MVRVRVNWEFPVEYVVLAIKCGESSLFLDQLVDSIDDVAGRDAEHVDEDRRGTRARHGGHVQMLNHKVTLAGQST